MKMLSRFPYRMDFRLQPVLALTLALLAVLMIATPHAFDLAIARHIWRWGGNAWHVSWFWSNIGYHAIKAIPGVLVLSGFVLAVYFYCRDRAEAMDMAVRFVVASLLSVILVSFLKDVSGVACPWSVSEFSGEGARITAPFAYALQGFEPQGACWPAGHAGTGFCLFGLFYVARRYIPRWRWLVLALILGLGFFAGTVRMFQGAHFFSHGVATLLIDLAVATVVFGVHRTGAEPEGERICSTGTAAMSAALVLTLANMPFLSRLMSIADSQAVGMTLSFAAMLLVLNFALMETLVRLFPRKGWRIFLVTVGLVGAVANAFWLLYGTIITPDMARNALATDAREVFELISLRLIGLIALLWLPVLVVAVGFPAVRTEQSGFRQRLWLAGRWLGALGLSVVLITVQMSSFASFMRNYKEARYQIMPIAAAYSFSRTLWTDKTPGDGIRQVIDPAPEVRPAAAGQRPLLVVYVVGETARTANWGLSGYERQTTPQIRAKGVVNFSEVTACGTTTDVSLPCMFSRVGREQYDRARILREESVLSVIARAGVNVRWVDNQSGCKGACTPAMLEPVTCSKGPCMDMAMVDNVEKAIKGARTNPRQMLVLHMMGSHGPAYWRRSTPETAAFGPGCRQDDMGSCPRQSVVDSYDNSILYTDQVLAAVIDRLAASEHTDAVLLYVSDHGESLGEKGLWLHGAPYWVAPREQTQVPMVMWMNRSAEQRYRVSLEQLRTLQQQPLSHDVLFDTLLGLSEIRSTVYRPQNDLLARVRRTTTD